MVSLIFAFLSGMFAGIFTAYALLQKEFHKSVGTLLIDRSDPDENPYMFLELPEENLAAITESKSVELTIRTENYIPHE